ncbi:hypothetical protein [Halioxenophilus sp. WMMB6]|uniref:hypothetical protein n=1 Tax=Halioxenophilus sp. WMMB6 TaxID=3073815 RepID=UPI00295F0781|nr:hypothetical protein [Halioxenophilus sp. WMMB6]
MAWIKRHCRLLQVLIGVTWLLAASAQAEKLYVVVNAAVEVESLSHSEVLNIFMGRSQKLDRQQIALPLDISSDHPEKAEFYQALIHRDLAEVNSYWTRVMFSGDASPPRQMDTYEQIRQVIRNNLGAIAYLPESELKQLPEASYRVVHVLGE